jgi:hypothetical protein
VITEPSRAAENRFRRSCSSQEILRDFEKLIEEKKLFGAAHDPSIIDGGEFDPAVVKKKEGNAVPRPEGPIHGEAAPALDAHLPKRDFAG